MQSVIRKAGPKWGLFSWSVLLVAAKSFKKPLADEQGGGTALARNRKKCAKMNKI